ncbi:hypothetical protein [Hoeflea alexandrii]|uniref:hypothetical protein n=1 Tax=Hoeflea alexandrii TaxID=288436 RepID=UPI0022B01529|nr:hypothetical protein [Hoeflea alexandrii]MCZ4288704.1 hypothetical protein [Hoeflea alexandrii]
MRGWITEWILGSGGEDDETRVSRMSGWRRLLGAFVLTLAVAGLSACGGDVSWRQKVTVTMVTPNGEVSGASVMEVSWSGGIPFIVGDARGGGFKLTGEAPVVKLGNGRHLFALIDGMDSKLLYQLRNKDGRGASMKDNSRAILGLKEPLVLPVGVYPLLVTFADINDPASVARVDPDDVAASFGPGYALSSITLAITDEKVTKGRVDAVLGWWEAYENRQLDGDRYTKLSVPNRFANSLNRLDFQRGL